MCRMLLSGFAVAAVALAQPALAATDPFVGKWKLDVPRSRIVDDFRVKALGSNRYAFNFEGSPTETIVADGTDQPGLPGTTLAVKAVDAHHLTVVRKADGHVIVSAIWKLAPDGRTLRDDFTNVQSDGSSATTHYLYRRLSGGSGVAGSWESTTPPAGLKIEIGFGPSAGNGLSITTPGGEKTLVFDGRDRALPGGEDGATMSSRRLGSREIEYTEKVGGKVQRVHRFEMSGDGKSLREILTTAGQATPNLLVFTRE